MLIPASDPRDDVAGDFGCEQEQDQVYTTEDRKLDLAQSAGYSEEQDRRVACMFGGDQQLAGSETRW